MKRLIHKILPIFAISIFFFSSFSNVLADLQPAIVEDYDPLVDINVTVEVFSIRSLEKHDKQLNRKEIIDHFSDPDFYLKVTINDETFTSETWQNTKYHYNLDWTATSDVPDNEEYVEITIQLWDAKDGLSQSDRLCDISPDTGISADSYDVELIYSIRDGHWTGDDHIGDSSGYGRLNGCDDGTIYTRNRDCEIWFSIHQNDYDSDTIPYWIETNEYGTDPTVSDIGTDVDNDDIPIEWEWKWDYDPQTYNAHKSIDTEGDSLTNYEEFLTSEWDSDPFRKDIYVELDQMAESPEGVPCRLPEGSKELIYTAFNRQNAVLHIDSGNMGGGEIIPFQEEVGRDELQEIYYQYFYHGQSSTWRRSVFHYGVVVYGHVSYAGAVFGSNRFYITTRGHENKAEKPFMDRDVVFASAYMHELGHTFDFGPIPGHNRIPGLAGLIDTILSLPYKSCMNYNYMYWSVDYSDGTHGLNDYNDWERMDYRDFEGH